ncbi:MAG: hypothetical protein RIK87_20960 [Fuerstiella sp.]
MIIVLLNRLAAVTLSAIMIGVCAHSRAAENQRVIVVVGAGGMAEYETLFATWAGQWQAAARQGDADVVTIGPIGANPDPESTDPNNTAPIGTDPENPAPDDSDVNRVGDRQRLQHEISEAISVNTAEPLWLVMIGHGTFDGRTARFNLRGPDVSAAEMAEMLAGSQRPVVVINSASCSAPFINALSGPNRTIITATKDGSEIQFARFGGYLAAGISQLNADLDRDGQTSLLEAWLFACQQTEQYYRSDGRLATEHALLDDNGDGKGTRSEVFEGIRIREDVKNRDELDGRLAHRWHLIRSEAERRLTAEQRQRRDQLEEKLEILRQRRTEFAEPEYLEKLEKILLPLAGLYAEEEEADSEVERNP